MFFIRSSNNKLLPQKCISIKHPKPITSKNSPPGLGFFWSGSSRLRYMSEPIAAPGKSQEIGVDKMQCSYAMLCHYANMPPMRTKSQADFSVYKLFTSWTHTHTDKRHGHTLEMCHVFLLASVLFPNAHQTSGVQHVQHGHDTVDGCHEKPENYGILDLSILCWISAMNSHVRHDHQGIKHGTWR